MTVHQKGLAPYTLTLKKISDHRYTVMVTLLPSATKGLSTWTLDGTDVDGGAETLSFTQRIR